MSAPVSPLGPTLPGPPASSDTIVLSLSINRAGDICWWLSEQLGRNMQRALADEIVATLEHFLKDFIRARG